MNNQKGSKAQRRADIEQNIEQILELIREHEQFLLSPLSPDQKFNANRRIKELRELLASQEAELEKIRGAQVEVSSSAPVPPTPPEADVNKNLEEIKQELKRGFEEVKKGQGELRQMLSSAHNQELQTIVALIQAGNVSQQEMTRTLQIIQQSLVVLQENHEKLSTDVQAAVAQAESALNSEASLQGKLELTLPIIPAFLEYKVELAATDSIDLNTFWENTQSWWNTLMKRAYKNLWSSNTIREYGKQVQKQFSAEGLDPLQAARRSLAQYREKVNKINEYLTEFEMKVNQGMSNLGILQRAQEEFKDLEKQADNFLQEIMLMNEQPDYPRLDLQRIKELSRNIANQTKSAVDAVANNRDAKAQINQIKRNLPTLQRLVKQLLAWLKQMSAHEN